MIIMNNKSYEKLSGKAKEVIDANIGTVFTNWFNKTIDDTEHENVEKVDSKMKGQEMHRLTDAERARWKERIAPVIDNYIQHTPDGQRVLDAFRKEVASIRSGT